MKIEKINISFELNNGTRIDGYILGNYGEWQQWGGSVNELSLTLPYIEAMNKAVLLYDEIDVV